MLINMNGEIFASNESFDKFRWCERKEIVHLERWKNHVNDKQKLTKSPNSFCRSLSLSLCVCSNFIIEIRKACRFLHRISFDKRKKRK